MRQAPITPAYHRVRNSGITGRSSGSRTFLDDVFSVSMIVSALTPLLPAARQALSFPKPGKSPSHGGNTGSNPVGDARKINHLCFGIGRQAAMYGKYAEWTCLNTLSSHKNPSHARTRESPTPLTEPPTGSPIRSPACRPRRPDRQDQRPFRVPPAEPEPGPGAVPPSGGSWDPMARGSLEAKNAPFLNGLEKTEQCASPTSADFSTG